MTSIHEARNHFIQGMSRIAEFWGFPRAMGAIFGVVYLAPTPLSLDEVGQLAGVSKGTVSTNLRNLERLKMVHKVIAVGDRKDYYRAETDFWEIVKAVLKEREKHEFDRALSTVGESLEMLADTEPGASREEVAGRDFCARRLEAMRSFFTTVDSVVATILAVDEFRLGAFKKTFRGLAD